MVSATWLQNKREISISERLFLGLWGILCSTTIGIPISLMILLQSSEIVALIYKYFSSSMTHPQFRSLIWQSKMSGNLTLVSKSWSFHEWTEISTYGILCHTARWFHLVITLLPSRALLLEHDIEYSSSHCTKLSLQYSNNNSDNIIRYLLWSLSKHPSLLRHTQICIYIWTSNIC